jgi:predicted nucleic acid-binding protein
MSENASGAMSSLLILDTDILIDAGRDISTAVNYLQKTEKQSLLAICAITQMELMVGCKNKTELRAVGRFLERFKILKLTETVTEIAIDLLGKYRLSHGLLIPDALIAATAISLQEPFVTKNQRDFRFIAELELLIYS